METCEIKNSQKEDFQCTSKYLQCCMTTYQAFCQKFNKNKIL